MAWRGGDFEFTDYVSVAERRDRARKAAEKSARKQGDALDPVGPLAGSKLVRTFWGRAWCKNLESYSDYANRIPRGRSYARHGAVIDLRIASGRVNALVSGTSTYAIEVTIRSLDPRRWKQIAAECTGKIDSLVDLLRGTLPAQVMEVVTHKERGLFPAPGEISFSCSCPDVASLCKHVAAVLYGVGMRLDEKPDLLFALRAVDHADLISAGADGPALVRRPASNRKVIKSADLSALFDIEVDDAPRPRASSPTVLAEGPDARAKPARGRSGAVTKAPPKAVGPKAIGPKAVGPKAVGPKAVGPKAIGPKAALPTSGHALPARKRRRA